MKPITEMTPEEKNRELCALLGIHWHEVDSRLQRCKCGAKEPSANPDFITDSGSVQLLRELEKQEWYLNFTMWLWSDLKIKLKEMYKPITTPGLLADKLIEWDKMRKENKP